MVFARHLENFIVTRQILPTYRDYATGQFYRDAKPSSIYQDLAKTQANPDTPRYRSGQAHGNSLLFDSAHNPPGR